MPTPQYQNKNNYNCLILYFNVLQRKEFHAHVSGEKYIV